ncbi:hypothetical protein LX97_02210 [Nonlabens dokdonensis]|jgi:predicted histidine transporter YuiF (NhaC family)|uniref:Uncharacterized protein n=2 Tax=Nonlabens dokdonensis TaxID=328515 RepID=L7WFC1_NONDD|nr:hypothetical protein [Nonlabens dokdonensis]AGC77598.1 hypothetical protein DDD_2471 [Nonlabens dokdonensis DSW-6]PZX39852.1 hypothetical protein LX97_02210 [Nonlabens dokdonensis]
MKDIKQLNIDLRLKVRWWESKRWIYNLVVLLAGSFSIYETYTLFNYSLKLMDIILICIWAIGANIFYSLGTLTELFDWHYFHNKIKIYRFRWFFFISGSLFSCLWTSINITSSFYTYPIIP